VQIFEHQNYGTCPGPSIPDRLHEAEQLLLEEFAFQGRRAIQAFQPEQGLESLARLGPLTRQGFIHHRCEQLTQHVRRVVGGRPNNPAQQPLEQALGLGCLVGEGGSLIPLAARLSRTLPLLKFLDQAALAEPGLTDQEDNLPDASGCRVRGCA
jgi:hypothetical protein